MMSNFDAIKYLNTPKWQVSRLGLERIKKLLDMLGNPQKKLKFVHVAGTNGKGSTCAYISQILIDSGYKTGQFTSPYIYDFRERIRINNTWISFEDLQRVSLKVKQEADKFPENDHPTEFELMTAVAFLYFYEQMCDIVVCEVGMGGRLDSTNVIEKEETLLSVVTPIEKDHTQFLGNTISEITAEKAAIFKDSVPVVSSLQTYDALQVISKTAKEHNCMLSVVDDDHLYIEDVSVDGDNAFRRFSYKNIKDLKTNLLAKYQPVNAACAIESCLVLKNTFNKINDESIKLGIQNCAWAGRFDIVAKNPYVIIDGGHNIQGVKVLIESLLDVFNKDKFIFIMGVLADKDYKQMVELLSPYAKKVYAITPPNPRCLNADDLANCFKSYGVDAVVAENSKAIEIAKNEANSDDVICAFGSLYSISSLKVDA